MRAKIIFTLSFLLAFFNKSFSQNEKEYYGVLKLNDSSFISYRLYMLEEKGNITGYSITDIGGDHETKSEITGFYNSKDEVLQFKEEGIVYTKSLIDKYDFCFVNFDGHLRKLNDRIKIKGDFKGLYNDGEECISGEIELMSLSKIEKKAVKLDKKIQRSNKVSEEKKNSVSVQKTIDTLRMNVLTKGQNLSMFTTYNSVTLKIYDSGKEDNDKISIRIDDEYVLQNYPVTKTKKLITIPLKKQVSTLTFIAENEGDLPPNTATVEIDNYKYTIEALTKLKKGEQTQVTIHKTKK